jgi:hypothetical protein
MSLRSDLQRWHKALAHMAGEMSLTMERRAAKKSDMQRWASTLKDVEKELQDALRGSGHGDERINRDGSGVRTGNSNDI